MDAGRGGEGEEAGVEGGAEAEGDGGVEGGEGGGALLGEDLVEGAGGFAGGSEGVGHGGGWVKNPIFFLSLAGRGVWVLVLGYCDWRGSSNLKEMDLVVLLGSNGSMM